MIFSEFKDRIRNLGFEEGVFDENPSHIVQATNRANTLLHNFEPEETFKNITVSRYVTIDLSEVIGNFSSLASDEPVCYGGNVITDYSFDNGILAIPVDYSDCYLTVNYINTDSEAATADILVPEPGYIEIKLGDINNYLSKSNKAPKIGEEDISDYYYLADSLIVNEKMYAGKTLTILYNRMLQTASSDSDIIDCREELIPFLELLTAYYILLDDDERKAVMFYNQFLELYGQYLQLAGGSGKGGVGSGAKYTADNQPYASVKGGIDIDNY